MNELPPNHKPPSANVRRHQPPKGMDAQERVRIYHSGRWVNHVRPAKLARDPLCQWCAYEGVVTPTEHIDHWKPLAQGGAPFDDNNLVSLCASHHSRKTAMEKAGKPLPPIVESNEPNYVIA